MSTVVAETQRLRLRELTLEDATFMLVLVNDPSWIRFIGDRGVRTLDDARRYLQEGPIASYSQNGYGLFLTELKENRTPIGICGIVRRPTLDDPDIGFAFLPEFCGKGYAYEAARATLELADGPLGMARLVAITDPANKSSIKLLEKLGLHLEKHIHIEGDDEELLFFARTAGTQV